MQEKQAYLLKANRQNRIQSNIRQAVAYLSAAVILCVFWGLKLTGITLAGEAFCGHAEHVHSAACVENGATLACGCETHTEECYSKVEGCPLEEHVHVESCYSDITADVETAEDWEQSVAEVDRQATTARQLVQVATLQLGQTESEKNFEVDVHGVRRGITRYGQWYGNPYGDWSAMFVSFCLHYAGVEDAPANAGPESMRMEWEQAGLYKSREEELPKVGNLLFLNMEDAEDSIEPRATFVAVITKVEDGIVTAIAGDVDGAVEEIVFGVDAPRIIGYGLVPEVSGYAPEIEEPPVTATGDRCYVWLDGTCGGLMSLGGSDNTRYTATEGGTMTLPTQWRSPEKYQYVLRGWYDISNNKYYEPGAVMSVTGNAVLYADWQAATYDIGEFNKTVDDETVSTNSFITTRLFDYGVLFNLLSERADITVNANGHSETWNLITYGNNLYNGEPTLNFILRDWDRGNEDISYPNGHNDINNPTEAGNVYPGLYTDTLRELLFNPETEVLGKTYVGEGDYLFQLCEDPDHDHYGYYYYNSERNAASYNQSDQRFYVYDYLECTRDSANAGNEGKYSDFLPFNSPYANTGDKQVNTYSYNGVEGEYVGTTHYQYDSRYNDNDNSTAYVGTNFWFGMSVDVEFYLPNAPGTVVNGEYGNQDVYGKDMHFRFTGDDDVWVFVDDTLVLDLGGLHGRESGDINFSTGEVSINGVVNTALSNALKSLTAGEHTLTLYYLERGSSMSNCAIYFNLAPRFEFAIQKEDVLTRDVLNGAQFSVYTDRECTVPAELWTSKAAHDNGEPATNTFTVTDGVAYMWGMGASNTYYIRETKPPDDPDYGYPDGIICLTFDKAGTADYNVEIIDGGSGVSPGFIVHGFRIDAETQQAYIVATNAPHWVKETTSVQVLKHWSDGLDHSDTPVTVYLTVTDPDGTVRRLQEAQLTAENDWMVRWDNLPKYERDSATLVQYGVEESYVSGYYSVVEQHTGQFEIVHTEWRNVTAFEDGREYILKRPNGDALSTLQAAEDTGYQWVSAEEAKNSDLALWTASVNNGTVRLTNRAGQTVTFYYGGGNPTDFFAWNQQSEDDNRKQYFAVGRDNQALLLSYNGYYLNQTMLSNGKFDRTNDWNRALRIIPATLTVDTTHVPIEGQGFVVTNTPLEKETSLTVRKVWNIPADMDAAVYEKEQVTVKLLANGADTGRTVTLTLKNGWGGVFRGLPYEDGDGTPIVYTVEEVWKSDQWIVGYGEVVPTGGSPPTYATTVTNTYRVGGPLLPTTGSPARLLYTVCGATLMLASFAVGVGLRRKRERRRE